MSSLLDTISDDDIKLTDGQLAYLNQSDIHSTSTMVADIVSSAGEKVHEEETLEEIKSYFANLVIQETGIQNVYNAWKLYKEKYNIRP